MAGKRLDINTASLEDLESLSGIGHAKAEAILAARKAHGFETLSDLLKIPGIGSSILDNNLVTCGNTPVSPACRATATPSISNTRATARRETRSEALRGSGCDSVDLVDTTAFTPAHGSRSDTRTSEGCGSSRSTRSTPQLPTRTRLQHSKHDGQRGSSQRTRRSDKADDCGGHRDATRSIANRSRMGRASDSEPLEVEAGADNIAKSNDEKSHQHKSPTSTFAAISKFSVKRKIDCNVDGKTSSPGKKCCLSDSGLCGDDCCSTSLAAEMANLRPSCSGALKKRIPSRSNPPPELADWLKTFQLWTHAERMLALDELISNCEPTQVRHMMSIIEPQFQRDFISLLPKELALYVLSFLEAKDLCRAAQTCRYWRVLAEDNLLWREKWREEGIDEALVWGNNHHKKSAGKSPWKNLYLRQKQIEHNWRAAKLRPPKVLKGHDDHVITCLEFSGTKIVSGSDDNTLKVWSAITGKCLRTLVGHTGGVWSSQMADNVIISGSTDRTLKVWNADTGQCTYTLYGHTSTVRCMHLYNKHVVSGSRDATLRVWEIESGQCLHVLMGHVAAVRCVQYDGRRVVSGAYDYMVKVWDPETETCLHTLQGHTNRVYSLQFDGTHIVSGSLDTSIKVWDVETGNCLHTLIGHQSLTSGMELKDSLLVSGNADSTVKVWDITTGQCLQTLQGSNKHQSAVTCLQFSKKFVITSSDDGTVKIWDLKTGDFLRNLVALDSGGSGGVVWRIRCSNTKLVCAVGSRNGTEETKLLVLDFDAEDSNSNASGSTNLSNFTLYR